MTDTTLPPAKAPTDPAPPLPGWAIALIVIGSVTVAGAAVFGGYVLKFGLPWKKRITNSTNINTV